MRDAASLAPKLRRSRALATAMLAAALPLAGCGSTSRKTDDAAIRGSTLTIYTSVPLHGASRVSGESVVSAETLALSRARYRIGRYRVVFKPLDDSTPQRGAWDPGQTTVNAKVAAQDPSTIGYIGEMNSGASAISIPILNRLGIPQISPASTAVGLTSGGAGAAPGEPEKYYPTGVRTYARIVPNDAVQALAQLRLQRTEGCTKTYVLDDGEVDGHDSATNFTLAAQRSSIHVVGSQSFDPNASDYRSVAEGVNSTGANCVLISAITDSNAAAVTKAIAGAMPAAKIFGSAGLAESTFADAAEGGIPTALDPRVMITAPTLDPAAYPAAAEGFYDAYAHAYGTPQPAAIYGFEAMNLMLSAIARASHGGREAVRRSNVLKALFSTRDRHSVLGTYTIQRDGDTTLRRYGAYRIVDGRLSFWRVLEG